MLKRTSETKSTLEKAEKLLSQAIEIDQNNLKSPRSELDRTAIEARLRNFRVQQSHATAMRENALSR